MTDGWMVMDMADIHWVLYSSSLPLPLTCPVKIVIIMGIAAFIDEMIMM